MIYCGDCLEVLPTLEAESVQCCVTSPPYYGLRDYGCAGQLGLEPTLEEYLEKLVLVFREVKRVLRKDGTLWMNMGDAYTSGNRTHRRDPDSKNLAALQTFDRIPTPAGLKPKDLMGVPWRLAFALQADGWWLRSDIIWHKANPMPESVTDRPTNSHEYLFLLGKSQKYFYDQEAVKEPCLWPKSWSASDTHTAVGQGGKHGKTSIFKQKWEDKNGGRNLRSVWTIATESFPDAHFATFPRKLVEPCILAGTSEKGCCPKCGSPWVRVVEKTSVTPRDYEGKNLATDPQFSGRRMLANVRARREAGEPHDNPFPPSTTTGWSPSCTCSSESDRKARGKALTSPRHDGIAWNENNGRGFMPTAIETTGWHPNCPHDIDPVPCTVLDPFAGSGTTGLVAYEHRREFIGIELSPDYVKMAERRLARATAQGRLF